MGKQVAMVIDLNKCIGCQACTAACKSLWTDEEGQEHMLWNNVETKPGPGYPRGWEEGGGGWKGGQVDLAAPLPADEDFGKEIPLNHEAVYFEGTSDRLKQEEPMPYGANWDEDTSSGDYPNNYHFYLPRLCNHCTKPSCLEACPVRAIYKREQDGIVLVDPDKCQGFRLCNRACPYDKVYFNHIQKKSQKCIFCFPRVEQGVAPACARQCPGRLRFVGFLEDEVPPILPSSFDEEGRFSDEPRIPMDYLRYLLGPEVDQALITLMQEMERKKEGKESELMDLLIAKDWKSLFNIPDVRVA
jgi:complex iron-sulfur molybdoenzyme family reductase subunit beta